MRMRWRFAGVLVLAATTLVGGVATAKPVSAPELTVSDGGDGSVLVLWRYRGRTRRRSTTLELERSEDGSTFAPLDSVARPSRRPRRSQGFVDEAPGAGTHWYRGRLQTKDGLTAWGPTVSIALGDRAGGPPDDGPSVDPPLPDGLTDCPAGTAEEVLDLINAARVKVDAKPLGLHPQLAAAARYRAASIAIWQTLSHAGWVDAIRAAGYGGGFLGENIAYGYKTPAKVMRGWLGSSGHRQNIENYRFHDVGVGCVIDPRGIRWWVQSFGG